MADALLYIAMTALGYALGAAIRKAGKQPGWVSRVLTLVTMLLVFTMGIRLGGNEEVLGNLNRLGLYALIFTLIVLASCIAGTFLMRKFMHIDRYGMLEEKTKGNKSMQSQGTRSPENATTVRSKNCNANKNEAERQCNQASAGLNKTTIAIICSVSAGIVVGYLLVSHTAAEFESLNNAAALVIRIGLSTLLLLIGIDLGLEGTVMRNTRNAGLRVLALPAVVIASSLLACVGCSFILPLSMHEALLVGSGLGWYSLAPGIIMDHGYLTLGAISFMHNILRELLSVICIPLVAKHVGYLEAAGMSGAPSMDVCLPIAQRATNSIATVYSFVSGLVISLIVPILVPLLL